MNDEIDERLERLTRATERVAPRSAFTARVMTVIEQEHAAAGFWVDLPRAARRVIPFAAIAAAASVIWALRASREIDDDAAVSQSVEQAVVGTFDTTEPE